MINGTEWYREHCTTLVHVQLGVYLSLRSVMGAPQAELLSPLNRCEPQEFDCWPHGLCVFSPHVGHFFSKLDV